MFLKSQKKELEIGGVAFGLTSGVITTLGMIVGLDSATGSKIAIIAAILTVAVSDSLSDALGMHLSEESRLDEQEQSIWTITLFTFIGKFVFSSIFLVPFLLLDNRPAVLVSIVAGIVILMIMSTIVARRRKESVKKAAIGHTVLAIIVIIASYLIGLAAGKII